MSGIFFAIPFAIALLLLVLWSYLIFHYLRTYAIRGDRTNATMLAVFLAGCLVCILISLALFLRIPWNSLTVGIPEGLGEKASQFFR